eukprot:8123881-Prorocentrum_lima.AAC.1
MGHKEKVQQWKKYEMNGSWLTRKGLARNNGIETRSTASSCANETQERNPTLLFNLIFLR